MPLAERLLWAKLRAKQVADERFHRQYSIGAYTVDFYCPKVKLAIEIDGDSHYLSSVARRHDAKREAAIEAHGVRLLRFQNVELHQNMQGVLEMIYETVVQLRSKAGVVTGKQTEKEKA